MKRLLLNGSTLLSLLLCVAVVALWVLSCWRYVEIKGPVAGRSGRVSLLPHAFWVEWTDRPYYRKNVRVEPQVYTARQFDDFFRPRREPPPVVDMGGGGGRPPNPRQVGSERYYLLGFGYRPPWFKGGWTFTSVGIPFWFPAAVLIPLPALWVRSKVRACSRRSRGRCPACGYDLRATPGRCPECGTIAPSPPAG